jgi:hypothetical protein
MRELWRICGWGVSAAVALVIAVFAGSTDTGHDRARYAVQQLREIVAPTGVQAARPLDANEGRRLAETVRALSADRERLLSRIAALEHNVDDMTGSITRFETAVRTPPAPPVEQLQPVAPPAPPPVAMTAPQTVAPAAPPKPTPQTAAPTPPKPAPQASAPSPPPPAPQQQPAQATVTTPFQTAATAKPTDPEVASSLATPELPSPESGLLPAPPSSHSSTVTKRQFGIDLGGNVSEDAARAAWNTALRRYGNLLHGLKPVVVPREHARGGMEYRLIAGPFNDASKAARFCAAITSMGSVCQPAMYDGQRVAGH